MPVQNKSEMQMAHSQAPWEAKSASVFSGSRCIAMCDTDNDTLEVYDANARLIAAAPDMLAALKVAAQIIGHPNDAMSQHIAAVIAKAEGR